MYLFKEENFCKKILNIREGKKELMLMKGNIFNVLKLSRNKSGRSFSFGSIFHTLFYFFNFSGLFRVSCSKINEAKKAWLLRGVRNFPLILCISGETARERDSVGSERERERERE